MQSQICSSYMERLYSFYSPFYDFFFGKLLEPGRRKAFRYLSPRPGQKILEIGIGTGSSLELYPPYSRVVGIDISPGMIEQAQKRAAALRNGTEINLMVMDAAQLEFPDNHFDAVVASYVITTVPDPHQVCREILRVTRPGGQIIAVNHTRSENGWYLGRVEDLLAPLCVRIGFTTDLDVLKVMRESGVHIQSTIKCNLLHLHRIITGTKK
ncbi:MAG: methyltransferase domain-containing protein [Deltaproteobacteria bacterium]|nr:methyltransferase domain-containing protein [Deltaproteobacteria bacterium]MBW1986536.1 methyltransferase domain-containing protein [Deltaproteobacteria bacterium]MBW2135114.1 methyltransferase domain-containing protein [Deltaproteobacteria bacterium]